MHLNLEPGFYVVFKGTRTLALPERFETEEEAQKRIESDPLDLKFLEAVEVKAAE